MRTIAEIGQMRLSEMRLTVGGGITVAFSDVELGRYSYLKKPVLVVMTGRLNHRQWVLMPCTKRNIAEHRGHCYLVKGRHVRRIEYRHVSGSTFEEVMSNYETADFGTPLMFAKTEAIFRAGCGHGTRKKPQRGSSRETANGKEGGGRMPVIKTKRFPNSKLTCVYKQIR